MVYYNLLRSWFITHGRCPVVLTTYSAQLSDADLEAVLSDFECLVPADCAMELELLLSSRIPGFRRRAGKILNRASIRSWTLEDAPEGSVCLFGADPLAAQAFSAKRRCTRTAIVCTSWHSSTPHIQSCSSAGEPLAPLPRSPASRRDSQDYHGLYAAGKPLLVTPRMRVASGSFGDVYRLSNGKMVKLFRYLPTGYAQQKLQILVKQYTQLPEAFQNFAAFPEAVVTKAGEIAGFLMADLGCRRLSDQLVRGGLPMEAVHTMLRSALLITLELRLLSIYLRDISLRNFMVAGNDVKAIDLDSAQLGPYLGSGRTPEYASPELKEGALITPDQQSFALAAMAFHILFGCPVFGSQSTPRFLLNAPQRDMYTDYCIQKWDALPAGKRQTLTEWFTLKCSVSMGTIITEFDLYKKAKGEHI